MPSSSAPVRKAGAATTTTGDLYITDTVSEAQFHLTVELAASDSGRSASPSGSSPSSTRHKRYTRVTGRALKHTVEKVLLPLALGQHPHRYGLLPSSHGTERRELTDDVLLPDRAVVEVTPCGCGCTKGSSSASRSRSPSLTTTLPPSQRGRGGTAPSMKRADAAPTHRDPTRTLHDALAGTGTGAADGGVSRKRPSHSPSPSRGTALSAGVSKTGESETRPLPPSSREMGSTARDGAAAPVTAVSNSNKPDEVRKEKRAADGGGTPTPQTAEEPSSRDLYYSATARQPSPTKQQLQHPAAPPLPHQLPKSPNSSSVSFTTVSTPTVHTADTPSVASTAPMRAATAAARQQPEMPGEKADAATAPPTRSTAFERDEQRMPSEEPNHEVELPSPPPLPPPPSLPPPHADEAVPTTTSRLSPTPTREKEEARGAAARGAHDAERRRGGRTAVQAPHRLRKEVPAASSDALLSRPSASPPRFRDKAGKAATGSSRSAEARADSPHSRTHGHHRHHQHQAMATEDPRVEQTLSAASQGGHGHPARQPSPSIISSLSRSSAGASDLTSIPARPADLDRTDEPLPTPPAEQGGRTDRPSWPSDRPSVTSTATSATIADVSIERVRRLRDRHTGGGGGGRASSRENAAPSPSSSQTPSHVPRDAAGAPSVHQEGKEMVEEESERVRQLRAQLAEQESLLLSENAAAEARLAAMHAHMDAETARVTQRYDKRARDLQKEMDKENRTRQRAEAASTRERRQRLADRQEAEETAAEMQCLLQQLNGVYEDIFAVWTEVLAERQRREEPPLTAFTWQAFHAKGRDLTRQLCEGVAYKHVYKAQWHALQLAELERQKKLEDLKRAAANLAYAEEDAKGDVRFVVRLRPSKDSVLRMHRTRHSRRMQQQTQGKDGRGNRTETAWQETVSELLGAVAAAPLSPFSIVVNERKGTVALHGGTAKSLRQYAFPVIYGARGESMDVDAGWRDSEVVGSDDEDEDEEEVEQARIFEEQLAPVLKDMCLRGRNVAVLGYGTTGSGKTHTLLGASASHGLHHDREHEGDGDGEGEADKAVGGAVAEDDESDGEGGGTLYQWCLSSSSSSSSSYENEEGSTAFSGGEGDGAGDSARHTRADGISAVEAPVGRHSRRHRLSAPPPLLSQNRRRRRQACLVRRGDGLLPRTLAWLCDRISRDDSNGGRRREVIFSRKALAEPVVLSFALSAFEVYNDRVYDLLADPIPITQDYNIPYKEDGKVGGGGRRQSDSSVALTIAAGGEALGGHHHHAKGSGSTSAEGDGSERRGVRQELDRLPTFSNGQRWDDGNMPKDAFRENPHRLVELVPFHEGVRRGSGGTGGVVDTGCWTVAAEEVVFTAQDGGGRQGTFQRAMACLRHAVHLRRTAATSRNTSSSRSHMFVKVRVTTATKAGHHHHHHSTERRDAEEVVQETEVIFCDLAGSERVGDGGPGASPLLLRREAQYINRSLCAVEDVLEEMKRQSHPLSVVEAAKAALRASQDGPDSTTTTTTTGGTLSIEAGGGGVSPTQRGALMDLSLLSDTMAGTATDGDGGGGKDSAAAAGMGDESARPAPPPAAAVDPVRVWAALVPRKGITLSPRVGRPVFTSVIGDEVPAASPSPTFSASRRTLVGDKNENVAGAEVGSGARAVAAAAAASATTPNVRTTTVKSVTRQAAHPTTAKKARGVVERRRATTVPIRNDKVTMLLQPALGLDSSNGSNGGGRRAATVLCFACLSPCSLGEMLPRCAFASTYERAPQGGKDDAGDKGKRSPAAAAAAANRLGEGEGGGGTTCIGVGQRGQLLTPPSAAAMLQRMLARHEAAAPLLLSEASSTLAFASQSRGKRS